MKYEKVVFTKVSAEVSKANRRFFERNVRKAFVKYLAYSHMFDDVLTDIEIEQAKEGVLPKDLDVHHIIPISGTADEKVNSFKNLTVLHKATHIMINRQIFEPQIKDVSSMQEGEKREIVIPVFKQVDAGRIVALRSGQMKRSKSAIKRPPLRGRDLGR